MDAWHGRELVVLMGAPGSGKSTFARRYPHVVTTDALRSAGADGTVGKEAVDRVYDQAFDAIVALLKANRAVVLDTPAAHPSVRKRALRVARAFRARATIVLLMTPVEVCVARQAARRDPVPEDAVRRMHAAIERQWPSVGAEGWDDIREV